MKKLILILFSGVLLSSCGASEVVREARATFDGAWTLTNISFPGSSENLNVTLFNDAIAECFTNSDWMFVSNNNTGSYEVTNTDCNTDTRFFIWSISDEGMAGNFDLLLKPTDADYNSTTGDSGFRLNLVTVSQTSMVWEQNITFEGSPFTIRMNFNKN